MIYKFRGENNNYKNNPLTIILNSFYFIHLIIQVKTFFRSKSS